MRQINLHAMHIFRRSLMLLVYLFEYFSALFLALRWDLVNEKGSVRVNCADK